ncbi:MAG: hypothetical protein QXT58_01465, partial [Archaeoglobaceae archaeon]
MAFSDGSELKTIITDQRGPVIIAIHHRPMSIKRFSSSPRGRESRKFPHPYSIHRSFLSFFEEGENISESGLVNSSKRDWL